MKTRIMAVIIMIAFVFGISGASLAQTEKTQTNKEVKKSLETKKVEKKPVLSNKKKTSGKHHKKSPKEVKKVETK